jgi:leucine-rich repeat protein SHOC2
MDSDMIFCILSHLPLFHILKCTSINKQFNHVSNNILLWKNLSDRDYPNKIDDDYKKDYMGHYKLYNFLELNTREYITKNSRYLDVSGRDIELIPPEICLLSNLEELYLHENELKSIPIEISRLTNLVRLDLDHNNLESIPMELGLLTKLRTLYVDKKQVHLVPLCLIEFTYYPQTNKYDQKSKEKY